MNTKRSNILNESKKQAEERFVDTGKINRGIFDTLLQGDISSNKKYIEKMCDYYLQMKENERWSHDYDLQLIMTLSHLIEEFDEACNKNIISGNDKDIQKYSNIEDFEEAVLDSRNKISNTQKKKKEKSENSVIVYEDDTWVLTLLLNWTGAKKVGIGTKWCITFNNPSYWLNYTWTEGEHFYVITNKILDREQVRDEEKNTLYKVAVEIQYNGTLRNMWDAPDYAFNPIINHNMNSEKNLWWESIPDKIKKIIQKPELEGKARKILVHNYSPQLGYNENKNMEKIIFKDFYINSEIPPINFSRMKNIDLQITGNIYISDTQYETLEDINFEDFPDIENIKIEGNLKLKSLKGLPKNIQGTLTIENNPELSNDSINDLLDITLKKQLTWKNNKEKTTMYDFIKKRWAPILGKIDAK